MNINIFQNTPQFISDEIEKIKTIVSPLLKKNFNYRVFSILLITISIMNLFFLLFAGNSGANMTIQITIYAVLGALGIALSKESRFLKKEIYKLSYDYILERIGKSKVLSEDRRTAYNHSIKQQPVMAMNIFFEFLNEEVKVKEQA